MIELATRQDAIQPAYFVNPGLALARQGRLDDALRNLDEALVRSSDHGDALNNRGNVLLGLRRFDEALSSYDRLIALRPDLAQAFNNRAIALKEMDRPLDADALWEGLPVLTSPGETFANRVAASLLTAIELPS